MLSVVMVACDGASQTAAPSHDPLPEAFTAAMEETVDALDAYWAPIAEREGFTYLPPTVSPYRSGEIPATACADDSDAGEWTDEAFYCFTDNTIVYDADFLHAIFNADGPESAIGILAHEWGHHLQSLTSEPGHSLQVELQADCYAGTYLSNASGDPAVMGLALDAMSSFVEAGNQDYEQSSWFNFQEHGSPELRWSALVTGALGIDDVTMCQAYGEYEPQPPIELGEYTLAHLPGFRTRATDAEATLIRDDVEIHVVPLDSPVGATAESIGLAVWDTYFEGFDVVDQPTATVQPTPSGGEWATWSYEATRGSSTIVGVLRIHASTGGGALLVDSSMDNPPVDLPLDDAELRVLMGVVTPAYGIENFLCAPGQSGERGADGYALSCALEFPAQ